MATKTKLSISDLGDIVADLHVISTPYLLGIQLNIDPSTLKVIEKNHPGDINRQKTEVIEYWLRNSSNASWKSLVNAVERLGEYNNLVKTLRETEQGNEESSLITNNHPSEPQYVKTYKCNDAESFGFFLKTYVDCNILLLGKMGHGKSTIGNRMLHCDGCFRISCQKCPQTCNGSALLWSKSQYKEYRIEVYDHDGLFEDASLIETPPSDIPKDLNLVVFVMRHGRSFDAHEREILKALTHKWKLIQISALVLTHCEHLSEKEREKFIKQFKEDHPSVAELMGKGILTVGFPDNSHVQPGSQMSRSVEKDRKKLRELIYSCDKRVTISAAPQAGTSSEDSNSKKESQPLLADDTTQVAQTDNRCLCCSIL